MPALKIKPIELKALPAIAHFPPKEWYFDIVSFYQMHIDEPYFKAYIGYSNDTPVVTGCILFLQEHAWLGSIITDDSFRSKGFGREMTKYLIEICQENHCESISLFGTIMGEELYRSLGFSTSAYYHFVHFANRKADLYRPDLTHIQPIKEADYTELTNIDFLVNKNYPSTFSTALHDPWFNLSIG